MKKNLYLVFMFLSISLFITGTGYLYNLLPVPSFIDHTPVENYYIPLFFIMGFITIFTGIYLVHNELRKLSIKNRTMSTEITSLNAHNTFFLQQMPLMKSNIESLSTMREISRAINIHVEFEKILEEVLRIISQMTGASTLDIFLANLTSDNSSFPLKAHFSSRGEHEYFYLYFESDPEKIPSDAIKLIDFRSYSGDNYSVADTILSHNGLSIGMGKVYTKYSMVNEHNQKLFLRDKISSFEINKENIARAIEVKNIIRVQDQSSRSLQFTAPLIAEQKVLGVIKMTIDSTHTDLDPANLESMLRESCRHISLAIKKADLYERAVKDGMTNLYNKPHFLNQLNIALALAHSNSRNFSLLMIDLDHFKNINDTYGHLTGDIILTGVANILRRNLREHDLAFRYGGEELAIILDNTGIRKASKTANRIRKAVRDKTFTSERGETINITISIGVSQYYPDVMSKAEDLISRADQALYLAKESGRNKVMAAKKPRHSK